MDNWLGSSLNQVQGWTTVRESYSRASEQRPLSETERSTSGGGGGDSSARQKDRPTAASIGEVALETSSINEADYDGGLKKAHGTALDPSRRGGDGVGPLL